MHARRVVHVERDDRQRLVGQADVRRERRRACRRRRPPWYAGGSATSRPVRRVRSRAGRARRARCGRRRSPPASLEHRGGVARRPARRPSTAIRSRPSFSVRSRWASTARATTSAPSPATSRMLTGWSSSAARPAATSAALTSGSSSPAGEDSAAGSRLAKPAVGVRVRLATVTSVDPASAARDLAPTLLPSNVSLVAGSQRQLPEPGRAAVPSLTTCTRSSFPHDPGRRRPCSRERAVAARRARPRLAAVGVAVRRSGPRRRCCAPPRERLFERPRPASAGCSGRGRRGERVAGAEDVDRLGDAADRPEPR